VAAVGPAPGRTSGPTRPPPSVLRPLIGAAALPGVGPGGLQTALRWPGGPEEGLRRLERAARRGLGPGAVERARGWAERALETIHRDGVHVLLPGDDAYPSSLLLDQPPCPLFGRGRLDLLDTPMVGVVGTRRASPYGRKAAHRIAGGIAASGATVVSGLARGIDGVAHRAAGPARTVAVLGSGIDVHFPAGHRELQEAIATRGLVLTEQLPGAPPARHNFPRRNRIIAALARGVVVVEAPSRSGALSTAARAADAGAHVFAVPGPIDSGRSAGANALIRDGATLVTSAREVLAVLGLPLPPLDVEESLPPEDLEGQGLALWRALGGEPRHVDEISVAVGLDPQRSLASLLALEVRGFARQLPGMRFVRA
jgi:DNA processing protein